MDKSEENKIMSQVFDIFKIYVDQLRDGHADKINDEVSPQFLEVQEKELVFTDPVKLEGETYLANDDLILHLNIVAFASIPCSICNERVKVEIGLNNFYHAEPLDNITTKVFDFSSIVREAILLEVPAFAECHEGKCPHRKAIEKYIKSEPAQGQPREDEVYRPFADLE